MIPSNTLLFRSEGLQVGVVRNGKVQLVPVTIGKDAGATVEISSGLTAEDAVILDPSDSLTNGQEVRIADRPASVRQPGPCKTGRRNERSRGCRRRASQPFC